MLDYHLTVRAATPRDHGTLQRLAEASAARGSAAARCWPSATASRSRRSP